jgi:hypothetical protein
MQEMVDKVGNQLHQEMVKRKNQTIETKDHGKKIKKLEAVIVEHQKAIQQIQGQIVDIREKEITINS